MKGIRRVVTGTDQNGQDVFSSDGPAPFTKASEVLGGWAVDIWEMGSIPPELSDDGTLTTGGGFPDTGSLVFRMVKMPPESALRTRRRPKIIWVVPSTWTLTTSACTGAIRWT